MILSREEDAVVDGVDKEATISINNTICPALTADEKETIVVGIQTAQGGKKK